MCPYGGQRETSWVPKLQAKGKSKDKDLTLNDKSKDSRLRTQRREHQGGMQDHGTHKESFCPGQGVSRHLREQDSLITVTEGSSSEKKLVEKDKLVLQVAFS